MKSSKNVLLLADVPFGQQTSGSERVLYNQAIGLQRDGFKVFVITRRNGAEAEVIKNTEGINEAYYRADTGNTLGFAGTLFQKPVFLYERLIGRRSIDAVICHQPYTGFVLIARKKLKHMPLIYVFHSPSHEEYLLNRDMKRSLSMPLIPILLRRFVEKYCLKKASRIMTLSFYMKNKIRNIHRIPTEKIIVNPGGVDLDIFNPPDDREALKAELGLQKGKIHFLTVRNLEPRMGLANLVVSMHHFQKKRIPAHLVIGGEGSIHGQLTDLIRFYDLSNAVTMTGFIPSKLLPKYYGASDFFILPTEQLEGFGLVTPEAMACGTPVLGTPIGGTKEILSKFTPQFIFNDPSPEAMADGIQKAIHFFVNDPEGYQALRKDCRKYAQNNYSWQRHINQLADIVQKIRLNADSCEN